MIVPLLIIHSQSPTKIFVFGIIGTYPLAGVGSRPYIGYGGWASRIELLRFGGRFWIFNTSLPIPLSKLFECQMLYGSGCEFWRWKFPLLLTVPKTPLCIWWSWYNVENEAGWGNWANDGRCLGGKASLSLKSLSFSISLILISFLLKKPVRFSLLVNLGFPDFAKFGTRALNPQ